MQYLEIIDEFRLPFIKHYPTLFVFHLAYRGLPVCPSIRLYLIDLDGTSSRLAPLTALHRHYYSLRLVSVSVFVICYPLCSSPSPISQRQLALGIKFVTIDLFAANDLCRPGSIYALPMSLSPVPLSKFEVKFYWRIPSFFFSSLASPVCCCAKMATTKSLQSRFGLLRKSRGWVSIRQSHLGPMDGGECAHLGPD